MFFVLVAGLLLVSLALIGRALQDKTPRRPLTPQEQMYIDLMYLQDRQNAIEEDRRRDDRVRNY
jgi:hypothetical protein